MTNKNDLRFRTGDSRVMRKVTDAELAAMGLVQIREVKQLLNSLASRLDIWVGAAFPRPGEFERCSLSVRAARLSGLV